jgi:hypothetical protein
VAVLDVGILPLLAELAQTEEDMYLRQELAMCFKYASGEYFASLELCLTSYLGSGKLGE